MIGHEMNVSRARSARRGGVLVLALMTVMAVSVLAAGFLQLSNSISQRQRASVDAKRAFYMAEAGLAEAYAALATGDTGNVGSQAAPALFGDGLVWVEADRNFANSTVTLESTGMVGSGRAKLQLVVQQKLASVAALGVFSAAPLELPDAVLVDGFDSSKGDYESQIAPLSIPPHASLDGRLGSNGDVSLTAGLGGINIFGAVQYGSAGLLNSLGAVLVTGGTTARVSSETLPPVTTPLVPYMPAKVHGSAAPLVLSKTSMGLAGLTVNSGAQVVLKGPLNLVLGSLNLNSGSEMVVDTTDGPINLYINGTATMADGSVLTSTRQDPSRFNLLVKSAGAGRLNIGADITVYGSIYAPKAEVVTQSGFELFGTLVADTITLSRNAKLHVDTSLGGAVGERGLPLLIDWSILDMPTAIAARGSDPAKTLGVNPAVLLQAKASHDDVWVKVEYTDTMGFPQVYVGLKSGLPVGAILTVDALQSFTSDPLFGGLQIK